MELKEWLILIGSIVLLLVSIAAIVFSVVKSGKRKPENLSATLAELSEIKVRVKDLISDNGGFFVIFESNDNEELKISISEEIFKDFNKDECGLLTLADGEFLNFVIEEI